MIIVTGANKDIAKDDHGRIYKNFSFKAVILKTVSKAIEFGYTPLVYDLGSLGIGEPIPEDDISFAKLGYYSREVHNGYKSKSLFKPKLIKDCMKKYNAFVVYLDGDAQLYNRIDEVTEGEYDVGVTLRDVLEIKSEWHQRHFDIVKYVNAGVIFFKPTKAGKSFIELWQKVTDEVGNDQMALNKLVCPDYYPEVNSILAINGIKIKYFPCRQYNYYYFKEGLFPDIKIMHFKGDVRHFYPFDRKKYIYCKTIIPILNKIRSHVKNVSHY